MYPANLVYSNLIEQMSQSSKEFWLAAFPPSQDAPSSSLESKILVRTVGSGMPS